MDYDYTVVPATCSPRAAADEVYFGDDEDEAGAAADRASKRWGDAYTVWRRRADSRNPWTKVQTVGWAGRPANRVNRP